MISLVAQSTTFAPQSSQDELPLLLELRLVHRHERGAEPVGGVARDGPLDAVVGDDGDVVAAADAETREPAAERVDELPELGVGDPGPGRPALHAEQRPCRELLAAPGAQLRRDSRTCPAWSISPRPAGCLLSWHGRLRLATPVPAFARPAPRDSLAPPWGRRPSTGWPTEPRSGPDRCGPTIARSCETASRACRRNPGIGASSPPATPCRTRPWTT